MLCRSLDPTLVIYVLIFYEKKKDHLPPFWFFGSFCHNFIPILYQFLFVPFQALGAFGTWAFGHLGLLAFGHFGLWAFWHLGLWAFGHLGLCTE